MVSNLSSFRERAALLLLAVLPLHALTVTVFTKVVAGPGHAPLSSFAVWKEVLLVVIVGIALIEIFWPMRENGKLTFRPIRSVDLIDVCILVGLFWAIKAPYIFSLSKLQVTKEFAYGFKYDFVPLVTFFILRRVAWSKDFLPTASKILFGMGVAVALYGIITMLLPMSFFTALGYSDLHSLYVAEGPLAAFQQIGGTALRRMQSTMSGPNQLGLWLLLPIGVSLGTLGNSGVKSEKWKVESMLLLIALVLTFSRAAWIAAAVMVLVTWIRTVKRAHAWRMGAVVLGCLVPCLIVLAFAFPSVFLRFSSSSDHFKKPVEAVDILLEHPLGLRLGAAGPASNATSETCVKLDGGADTAWAKDRPDLCVFVAGVQVQPQGRECDCPILTENWYLQWAVEFGWVGLIVSLLIPFFVLRKREWNAPMLAFLGISIAGLFLHSFEDAAVAYTVWILLAVTLQSRSAGRS